MKRKKTQKSNYDRPATVIGKDTLLETGRLESKQSVQVNGKIISNMEVLGSLVIGQLGLVEGDINATFILIAGKVVGNITVGEQIHLTKTAVVIGNIDCQSIIIDDGAKIKGSLSMRDEVIEDDSKETKNMTSDKGKNKIKR